MAAGLEAVSSHPVSREFAAGEFDEARRFIESLPGDVRVYIDQWDGLEWTFLIGDSSLRAVQGLYHLTPGARFRIRPVDLR